MVFENVNLKFLKLDENLNNLKKLYNIESINSIDFDINIRGNKRIILESIGVFNQREWDWLVNLGIGEETILKNRLCGLSNLNFGDGVLIPIFDGGKLNNFEIYKLCGEHYKIVDNLTICGLDDYSDGEDIWIVDKMLDKIALNNMGMKSISMDIPSTEQIFKILEKNPKSITIVSCNKRFSYLIRDIFDWYFIPTKIVGSGVANDITEHYFKKMRKLEDLVEVFLD